ncbi:MAG TPA: choice-of-anchor D domain-containing protein [Terriglobales bacterium]|nr:choice-of-anchor D domain-containing protein [Terriglobales bacterium]
MTFDLCSEGPWKKPVKIAALAGFFGCFFLILIAAIASPAQNVINTVAGGGNPAPGNVATTASLAAPWSAVADNSGNIYVSSADGEYVFQISTTNGNQTTILAGAGYSGYGISGNTAPATTAALTSPLGLVLDGLGNLYIADGINGNHVFKMSLTAPFLMTNFAGSASASNPSSGFGGYSGDGGPATQAQLNVPAAVAIGPDGTVYIADSGNNVIRAVATNGTISTFAGNGTACTTPPACGDNGPATSAMLNDPQSVAVDAAGDVFIADTLDQEIREVSATTKQITTVAGNGTPCNPPGSACGDGNAATLASLYRPAGIFVDGIGDIYIADNYDAKVREVISDGGTIFTVAGDGQLGFDGDGPATSVSLAGPTGVSIDPFTGNVLIVDSGNNRVRVITEGQLTTIAGGGGTVGSNAPGGDGGTALNAVIGVPYQVALDAANDEFIVDNATCRIREVNASTQVITTVAGSGTLGYSGDGGPATLATLNFPEGVAVDRTNGNLFIADTQTDVIRTVQGGVINTYAGLPFQPCLSPTSPCGDGAMGPEAFLTTPGAVALGSGTLAGDVILADTGDNKIRLVNNVGTISTVAGSGKFCLQPTTACGDGGPATLADLSVPSGVAVDSAGDIFIADAFDNRIRRVDATTQIITTVAFNGQATFSGDGGPATLASMNNPGQVFVDAAGNLFVGSSFNPVVRRIDAATGTVSTVAGNPAQPQVYGFAGDGGPATSATLSPFGVAVSSAGTLYIADTGNNRIRTMQLGPTSSPTPTKLDLGTQMIGGTSSPMPVTLANTGSDDLLITSITDANAFSETNNCPIKPNVLAPGQSCTINVVFTPTGSGAATDTLIITDNAPGSPHNIPLSATGQAPFQLTTNCTSLTVVPGQSAIYTVSLAPAQGFTKSVALSCSGVPALATCTVNPNNITLDGATTVQAQVTATTMPPTADLLPPSERTNRLAGVIGFSGMAGLAGLVLLPGTRRAKQARKLWAVLFCLCLISTVATMSSCGSGLPPDPPGTAAGTYPLTVTATFQSGSGTAFTEKVSFDLVVQ